MNFAEIFKNRPKIRSHNEMISMNNLINKEEQDNIKNFSDYGIDNNRNNFNTG